MFLSDKFKKKRMSPNKGHLGYYYLHKITPENELNALFWENKPTKLN